VVNSVAFSPDGCFIASGSFDKSCFVWDGIAGSKIGVLRGHVGRIYQVFFVKSI
jgi:WD40 repeat protein